MSIHMEKAQALAAKIEQKARDVLEPLAREMKIMQWPAEYRSIVWGAVAHHAASLAAEPDQESARKEQ